MSLRRAIYGWLTEHIVGLLCLSVMDKMPCFSRVDLIVLKVSRYVTRSFPCFVLCARLVFRLFKGVSLSVGNEWRPI